MARNISGKSFDRNKYVLQHNNGGSGCVSIKELGAKFGLVAESEINQPGGVLGFDANGKIPASLVGDVSDSTIINGPTAVNALQVVDYTIVNYSASTVYNITFTGGTFVQNGNKITVTAGNSIGSFVLTVNGTVLNISVVSFGPNKPVATVTGITLSTGARLSINTTAYSSSNGSTHASTSWQVASDAAFTTILYNSVDNATNKVSVVTDVGLATFYYLRVRFKDQYNVYGLWSEVVSVAGSALSSTITTPVITATATKSGTGAKFVISSSAFADSGNATHTSTVWQISGNAGFTDLLHNVTDTVNKTSKTITQAEQRTTYYLRVSYVSSTGVQSGWSSVFSVEYAVLTNGVAASENGMLVDTPATANDRLGSSVAISDDGQTAVVGIPNYQGGCGRILIFKKTGNAWAIEEFINGTTVYTYDARGSVTSVIPQNFGIDVEISGDGNTVCFNSYRADGLGNTYLANLYRIYLKINNIWTEKYSIAYTYGSASNMSIKSSYDGSRIIGKVSGDIVIATLKSDKTNYTVNLPDQAYENNDESGGNVGVSGSGDRVFYSIYAPVDNTKNSCNRIRVVRMEETTQVLETSLYPDVANKNNTFGLLFTVNKTGQYLAAYDSEDSSIYVFVRNGTTWTKQSKFTAPAITIPTADVCKLMAMNEDGSVIALGVPSTNKVIYYSYNGVSWAQDTVVKASIAGNIGFGTMVDMTPDGTNLISGAPLQKSSAGAAFVFS